MTFDYSHKSTSPDGYNFRVTINSDSPLRDYGPNPATCIQDCVQVSALDVVKFFCESLSTYLTCSLDSVQFYGPATPQPTTPNPTMPEPITPVPTTPEPTSSPSRNPVTPQPTKYTTTLPSLRPITSEPTSSPSQSPVTPQPTSNLTSSPSQSPVTLQPTA